jgi:tetratricopeptide (TPR) repeat protein
METSPHALVPCIYLAAHYDQEAMYDKAINAYKEAMKRDSDYDLSYLNMAGDYLRMNNYQEAENTLRLDLHRNPNNATAVFNLGLVVFQYEHKDSQGVELWKKSVSIDSGFAKPYKVLSQYYQAVGDSSNTILYRNFYIKKMAR